MEKERLIKIENKVHPTEKLIFNFIQTLGDEVWEDFVYDWNVNKLSKKEMYEWYFADANGIVTKQLEKLGSKIINYLTDVELKDKRLEKYSGVLKKRENKKRMDLPEEIEEVIKVMRNHGNAPTRDIVEFIHEKYKKYEISKDMIYMNIKYYISHGLMKARESVYDGEFAKRLVELYKGDKNNLLVTVETLKDEFPEVDVELNINKVRGIYFRNKDK